MERATPQPPQSPSPRREGAPAPDTGKDEEELDHDLEQTFPASDPVPPKHVD